MFWGVVEVCFGCGGGGGGEEGGDEMHVCIGNEKGTFGEQEKHFWGGKTTLPSVSRVEKVGLGSWKVLWGWER